MNSGKTTIHEYDSVIYPFYLWVVVKPTLRQLKRFYNQHPNCEVTEFTDDEVDKPNTIASVYPVTQADYKKGGVLVAIYRPKEFKTKHIAHESAHCADYITETLGISSGSFNHGEAYAYIVGWVADCIEKTTKKKRK